MHRLFLLIWLLIALPASANTFVLERPQATLGEQSFSNAADFLPVRQAFRLSLLEQTQDKITVRFVISEGYYLYQHRFKFSLTPTHLIAGEPRYPEALSYVDDYFGETRIYRGIVDIELPVKNTNLEPFSLVVDYQGCADKGLCYPPEQEEINLGLTAPKEASADRFSWQSLALFFLAGLGLTFTPCVLPMLPILSGVVLKGQIGGARALSLSLAYVLPMAICFAALGALMGVFGAGLNLQARLQSPWILVPFAFFFVAFALAMFGAFELRLPRFISEPLDRLAGKTQGGSLLGAAALGVFSSLLVSPCVSAPLAGALLYISTSGDALGGALQLFALGLGMGAPLVIFAVGGRTLLPKAGTWMIAVRNFFGILLLAVAVWMLERVLPGAAGLLLWGALALGIAIYCLTLAQHERALRLVLIALSALLLSYSAAAVIGAAQGGSNPTRPWQGAHVERWQTITTQAELNEALLRAKSMGQVALIDWYADWCISCKVIERDVLNHPQALAKMNDLTLIRLDITQSTPEQRALLDHYQLFGPPALLFIRADGREATALRFVGEFGLNAFLERLFSVTNES